jgi:hypothetical protein
MALRYCWLFSRALWGGSFKHPCGGGKKAGRPMFHDSGIGLKMIGESTTKYQLSMALFILFFEQ